MSGEEAAGDENDGRPTFGQRLRNAFIHPGYDPTRKRPDVRGLSRIERRRAKVRHQMAGGRFRTWVYAAALVLILAVFALLLWMS